MNYSECTEYLDRLGNEVLTMKLGLEPMRALLKELGNPESDYPALLVAGTNGKGSVARFVASICSAAQLGTGLFTSPHLVSIRERLSLSGRSISEEEFARNLSDVVGAVRSLQFETHPTFFETVTATALLFFSRQQADLAVLEVGLGGRLDSTNVVDPILSLLTPVSYDHQQYLGETLAKIAAEKAGILRESRPALSLPQISEVNRVLQRKALQLGAHLEVVDMSEVTMAECRFGSYSFTYEDRMYQLSACGKQQVGNAALALKAVEELRELGFDIDSEAVARGIESTVIPGVLELIDHQPPTYLDGGHNPAAATNLVNFLISHTREPRKLAFGIMRDKEIEKVLEILREAFQHIYLTQIDSPRAASLEELKKIFPDGEPVPEPLEALASARSDSSTAVVAGSFHLIGEILAKAELTRHP